MTDLQEPPTDGLSSMADGRPVPSAWDRARRRAAALDERVSRRVSGWAAAISVTLLAFAMRVWHLGSPDRFAFDETYYAKDAWSMANHGFVRNYLDEIAGDKIDEAILAGQTQGVWDEGPSMIVHPEVGKWLISLGGHASGQQALQYRIMSFLITTGNYLAHPTLLSTGIFTA